MKKLLLPFSLFLSLLASAQTPCSELFISEYVEGTGNDKAIEIYNPTGASINLTGYRIERFSNGSSTSSTGGVLNLSGSIAPYSTFVIANGQTVTQTNSPACSPALQALAQQLDGVYPAPTYMNGNDAIALYNGTVMIDLIGKIGDPGMTSGVAWSDVSPYDGSVGAWWTKDHSLFRKSSVKSGVTVNPDPFIVTVEWDSLPNNTWTGLGSHTCDCLAGINELTSNMSFVIYPNPSSNGQFTILSNENIEALEIVNMLGQVVFDEKYSGLMKTKMIDVTDLPKGLYSVNIKFNNLSSLHSNLIVE